VSCRRSSGLLETIKWSALQAVIIKTTSNGPFVDDVFWVLVGQNSGCVVPSETSGSDELLKRLQALPGFDNNAVIRAMSSMNDKDFLCWKKDAQ
jgi:hypothetical protein